MLERGYAVFGALNDFIKVSDTILHCWGRILQESPGAHLRLHRAPKGERIERAIQILSTYGVDRSRISCSDWVASKTSGGQYHGVDIALDSYPYNGVTTTCESFWMGLPVISLRGRNSVSRSGYSLLEAMDLSDLAAADEDAYVRAAVELAQDVPHLSELRQRMRALMRSSGLLDEASFVGSIESLYLQAWDDRVKAFAQPASRSTPS
jgi:predicted O-linked N-acetylglucosamine transferase (SPINDLY family)